MNNSINSDIVPDDVIKAPAKGYVLAVEHDDKELNSLITSIRELGYDPIAARNGREALDILHNSGHEINMVFLDKTLPVMDGLAVMREVQKDPLLRQIPVVMHQTAANEKDVRAGIDSGVSYFMTEPYEPKSVRHIMDEALHIARQQVTVTEKLVCHKAGFEMMQTAKYEFRTMQEAEALSCFIANMFPDPTRVVTGIAELMFNAVEHGNLEISYQEKKDLMRYGRWQEEISRRLHDPLMGSRKAEIAVIRRADGVYLVIADEGKGFDWKQHIRIDPSRASDNAGRGIAHAGTVCFDSLTFNDKGNRAVAFVRYERPMKW